MYQQKKEEEEKNKETPMVKLSVKEYEHYQRRCFEKLYWKSKPMHLACAELGITKKTYHLWRMRMVRNGTT